MKDLLEKFVIIAKDTENVDASKYRALAFKLKQRLMKSYPQLVFCVPKMRNVSEIVYVENLDSSELVEEHMSVKGLFIWKPGWRALRDSPVSGMNLSCVYMRNFHPACRDNFVTLYCFDRC